MTIEMKITGVLVSAFLVSVLFVSTVLAGSVSTDVLKLSEPVEMGSNHEVFGDPMPNKSPGLSLSDLIEQKQSHLGKEVRVSAKIAQVCQAKGCFFIAMEGEKWARITFRDYGFFVPTDAANSLVLIEGIFSEVQLSGAQAHHYQTDLGSSSRVAADNFSPEYSIVASSVLIHKQR